MVLDPEITIVKVVEIPEALIKMRSDGIMHVFYKENVTLDIELQTRMAEIFRSIAENQKANFIFEADEGFVVTREVRENPTKIDENAPVNASAIIVKNLAARIVANFFIKTNKSTRQFKLFTNLTEAAEWLKSL